MSEQGPTVFNGRYELLRHIARGGMADVYLARDDLLGREVAVKVLSPEFANDPNFVERFRREAQAAANLNHPNIVGIYDWGQERGTYYIVMEYVSGRSMSDVLRSTGPLHPDRAAEIAADVAAALVTAHGAGLVHRDIKLGNILVSDTGDVKVADFGIATALGGGNESGLTQHGSVMGTATYFSPEQAQGRTLDGRSDLYSLGVVLYEMLAGQPPFQAETSMAVAYKHVQEKPEPLISRGVQVVSSLQAITMKLLAKNPANRYPTADDLRRDLRRYLAGAHAIPTKKEAADPPAPVSAPTPPIAATTAQAVTPQQPAQVVTPPAQPQPSQQHPQMVPSQYPSGYYYDEGPPPSGSPWRTVALIFSLLVLVVILGFLFWSFVGELGGGSSGTDEKPDEELVTLVDVPDVVDLDVSDARAALLEANLNIDVRFETNSEIPVNQVFGQDPPSGQRVEAEAIIMLRVSSGTADTVPNVIGETREAATASLNGLGYQVTEVQNASPQDTGVVIGQTPASGAELASGGTVELSVSSGPEVSPVPDVGNLSVIAALNALRDVGFTVVGTPLEEASETIAVGDVVRTEPAANALVPSGSNIAIVVSTGFPQVTVPPVKGIFTDTAVQALRNAGLEPIPVFQEVADGSAQIGRVITQLPAAFEEVDSGTAVTITIGAEAAPTTPSVPTSSTTSTSTP